MAYFKRRKPKTVNKNQEKAARNRREAGRPLSSLYPNVQRLVLDLSFVSPQGDLISEDQIQAGPSDVVDLAAPCPGRCGDGSMDLQGKVDEIVRRHETSSESRGRCARPAFGSGDPCGTELRARIDITYLD
jgi:hypothetical protein